MDRRKFLLSWLITVITIAVIIGEWQPVKAQTNFLTINHPLEPYQEIDVSLGRAGIYFPNSHYKGSLILARLNPEPTEKINFTQRWIDIQIYDSNGREIKTSSGYVFVYFNLDQNSRLAWDQGLLSIFHYNNSKDIWKECKTRLVADKNAPYGRVRTLIVKDFGLYGLAIEIK